MFRCLHAAGDIVFASAVLGQSGQAGLAEFWNHVKNEDDYRDSPAYDDPNVTVPVFFMWMAQRPPSAGHKHSSADGPHGGHN
jgi:hypothetical protein